jgi:tRNA nucleotidyltransferase/poly(A) polymerase
MKNVQQKIDSSEAYLCGGTPRDRYLKHLENISDLDITTGDKTVDYLSQEFSEVLKRQYNVTRKTMSDGHSSIYIGSFKMDFSSNFNVPNIEALLIKQGITNPTNMQKEMFSRDFTCNALLLSLDLKQLTDVTHRGFKDIKDRMIRTCLSPDITLTTNRNRVARAIYLAAKLDFDVDPSIIDFVQKNPESIKIASDKSLAEKLDEAFTRDADKASFLISKMNIWNHIPITKTVYPYYAKIRGNNGK